MQIKTTVKPALEKVKKELADKRKQIADTAIPHKKISIFLDRWVQDNFKTEGKSVGGWTSFKIDGRRKKGKFDPSAKLLQDTGRLRSSFYPFANKSNAGIGSKLPYAKIHNEGLGVPERRILPYFKEVEADVRRIYDGHIKESIK